MTSGKRLYVSVRALHDATDRFLYRVKQMDPQNVIDLSRNALTVAILIAMPALLTGMLIGLVIGLLQALTQIQEQTLSFVPKILGMMIAVGLTLPWLLQIMMNYTTDLINNIPHVLTGG